MDEQQVAAQAKRWSKNAYSYVDLFKGGLAVRVKDLIAHLEACNLTHEQAIGWLMLMVQTKQIEVISLDLVKLYGQSATLQE